MSVTSARSALIFELSRVFTVARLRRPRTRVDHQQVPFIGRKGERIGMAADLYGADHAAFVDA